jgi:hypothetical protein
MEGEFKIVEYSGWVEGIRNGRRIGWIDGWIDRSLVGGVVPKLTSKLELGRKLAGVVVKRVCCPIP